MKHFITLIFISLTLQLMAQDTTLVFGETTLYITQGEIHDLVLDNQGNSWTTYHDSDYTYELDPSGEPVQVYQLGVGEDASFHYIHYGEPTREVFNKHSNSNTRVSFVRICPSCHYKVSIEWNFYKNRGFLDVNGISFRSGITSSHTGPKGIEELISAFQMLTNQ